MSCFCLNFLFCIQVEPTDSVVIVTGESEGAQPCKYMHPFSPKLPSHPDCHITLSRVSCAIE